MTDWLRVYLVYREAFLSHPDLRLSTYDYGGVVVVRVFSDAGVYVAQATILSAWIDDRARGGETECERYARLLVAAIERIQRRAMERVPA